MAETIEDQEFTCPRCGGHAFGTGDGLGHCNGYIAEGEPASRHGTVPTQRCGFSWSRTPEEDAKVFKGTGRFSPKYQTAQAVVRSED